MTTDASSCRGTEDSLVTSLTALFVLAVTVPGVRWSIVLVRLGGGPSRDRVAVWRELRRGGAVPLAQGVWTVPATPVFLAAVERAAALAGRGGGEVVLMRVDPEDEQAEAALRDAFLQIRLQE